MFKIFFFWYSTREPLLMQIITVLMCAMHLAQKTLRTN